jgi:hypothetical protein
VYSDIDMAALAGLGSWGPLTHGWAPITEIYPARSGISMKMYSLSPLRKPGTFGGSELAELIIALEAKKIMFGMKEYYTKPWQRESLVLPEDRRDLVHAMNYLANNQGFFTVSSINIFLMIPFERSVFNIIVNDDIMPPAIARIEIADVTEVLNEYRDMYNNFGLSDVFGRSMT